MSPRSRVKFLCSYGGKILPRPSDGQLKYIGGDTRVIAVPRSISFSELKKKMDIVYNGEAMVKYQLMPEDLDALVSVTCDEDLRYMFDEHDRQPRSPSSGCGSPRLRVFLFPTTSSPSAAATPEQRYLDAINGIPIMPQAKSTRQHSIFTLSSSACTSPTSTIDMPTMGFGGLSTGRASGGGGMHRVRSTPNIGSLRSQTSTGNNLQQHLHQHHHFPQQLSSLQKQLSLTSGMYPGSGGRSAVGTSIRYQQPFPQPSMYCLRPPLAGGPRCTNSGHMEEMYGSGYFYDSAAYKHGFD
ncbi:PB1 domain-containing protein [Dioscorea alata]|uniref:PB1 domain-containing protein n=1 Tax=Dioscorea alata TaxID=55571 RepID=A0ACB7WB75_DIOAL|nr:PB1 domain-containing protein [Dioscorea alata]